MKYQVINGLNPFDKANRIIKIDLTYLGDIKGFERFIDHVYKEAKLAKPDMKKNQDYCFIEYSDEKAMCYLIDQYIEGLPVDHDNFSQLLRKDYIDSTGWTTRLILAEVEKRNIPWSILGHVEHAIYLKDNEGFIFYYFVLGFGQYQKRIQQSITDVTSDHAVQIATNKSACKRLLAYLDIPTPRWMLVEDRSDIDRFKNMLGGSSLVLKPNDDGGGVNCFVDLQQQADIHVAYQKIKSSRAVVLAEEFVSGEDIRLCVIDYQFVCAISRVAPSITGDGSRSITELIDELERDNQKNPACRASILIDEETIRIISSRGYTLSSILENGVVLPLQLKANISSGAMVKDVTYDVSADLCRNAEKICRYLRLNIAAVDCIITEDGTPYVIEVNACPGLDNHMCPNIGSAHDFAKVIVDGLFKKGELFRVPLIYINDPNHLYGPYQARNHEDVLKSLQDPGLEYLVFHTEDFWVRGLPVHEIDMMVFFNEKNENMLDIIDERTIIVFSHFSILQSIKKRKSGFGRFRQVFYIDQGQVKDVQGCLVKKINGYVDLVSLITKERLLTYDQQPSIMIPKEFSREER